MQVFEFTQRGTGHMREGKPNQDALETFRFGRAGAFLVADGMSSAEQGGKAARICVEAGKKALLMSLVPVGDLLAETAPSAVRAAFGAAFNALNHTAKAEEIDINELKTTFMVAVVDAETGILHYGHCGDGGIIARLREGQHAMVTAPQKGETHSQTTEVLQGDWVFGQVGEVEAFAIATDGLYDCLHGFDRTSGALTLLPVASDVLERLAGGDFEQADETLRALFAETVDAETLRAAEAAFASGREDEVLLGGPFACVTDDRTVVAAVLDASSAPAVNVPSAACGASAANATGVPAARRPLQVPTPMEPPLPMPVPPPALTSMAPPPAAAAPVQLYSRAAMTMVGPSSSARTVRLPVDRGRRGGFSFNRLFRGM